MTLLSNVKFQVEDFFKFCGLLRISKLYSVNALNHQVHFWIQSFNDFFFFIYRDIGFKRKAAFFLRVAAMRCVAPNNPHPDWALCYNLLLKANAGYCIQLSNTLALNPTFNGWPALQVSLVLCLLFYHSIFRSCPHCQYSRLWNRRSPWNKCSPWNIWQKH